MAVGVTPGGQCQKYLRERKQGQQGPHRHGTVALLEGQERRGHAHASHAGVQTNLPCNQPCQFTFHAVVLGSGIATRQERLRL